jgi:hypothetical protein
MGSGVKSGRRVRDSFDQFGEALPRASTSVRVGPPTRIKQADDPCRTIKIVALAGQLCAAAGDVLIVSARATQKLPVRIDRDEKSAAAGPAQASAMSSAID